VLAHADGDARPQELLEALQRDFDAITARHEKWRGIGAVGLGQRLERDFGVLVCHEHRHVRDRRALRIGDAAENRAAKILSGRRARGPQDDDRDERDSVDPAHQVFNSRTV